MRASEKPILEGVMPGMLRHAGVWKGIYRHIDDVGNLIDEHETKVECVFPSSGPYAYIQHNKFTWSDGREFRATLNGELRDGRLWWENDRFSGWGWETFDGIVLLNLDRKDEPGVNFFEMITIGSTGTERARTWQWFKDGKLIRRTLCNEELVQT